MWAFVCFDSGTLVYHLYIFPIFMKLRLLRNRVKRKLETVIIHIVLGIKSSDAS